VVLALAGLTLAGCATVAEAPQLRDTWGYRPANADHAQAGLIYGLPESDVLTMAFDCAPASGHASLRIFGGDLGWNPRRVDLRSGVTQEAFALTPNPGWDVELVLTAPIDPQGPLATAFERTGRLEIQFDQSGDWGPASAPHRREHGGVRAFWPICRAR
jgi:hypothetical protein